jgi:SseB protein N-terminal domain
MTTPGSPASPRPANQPPGWRNLGGGQDPGAPEQETPEQETLALPELVIVPAHPVTEGGSREVRFELREGADGAAVLPVFSSVQRLAEALGGAQPWVALPLRKVRELAAAGQVHTVMLDPQVQPGAWRWRHNDIDSFQGSGT